MRQANARVKKGVAVKESYKGKKPAKRFVIIGIVKAGTDLKRLYTTVIKDVQQCFPESINSSNIKDVSMYIFYKSEMLMNPNGTLTECGSVRIIIAGGTSVPPFRLQTQRQQTLFKSVLKDKIDDIAFKTIAGRQSAILSAVRSHMEDADDYFCYPDLPEERSKDSAWARWISFVESQSIHTAFRDGKMVVEVMYLLMTGQFPGAEGWKLFTRKDPSKCTEALDWEKMRVDFEYKSKRPFRTAQPILNFSNELIQSGKYQEAHAALGKQHQNI